MFWLINKKNNFQILSSLVWRPEVIVKGQDKQTKNDIKLCLFSYPSVKTYTGPPRAVGSESDC